MALCLRLKALYGLRAKVDPIQAIGQQGNGLPQVQGASNGKRLTGSKEKKRRKEKRKKE